MAKPLIITKIHFIGRGPRELKKLEGMVRYFQYRDGSVRRSGYLKAPPGAELKYPPGVSNHQKPAHRDTRWVDRGMGETYRAITRRAAKLAGRRTTARLWVISPDPEVMQHVPGSRRMEVLQRTTERALANWYDDNGWGSPEFSFVLHDKERGQDGMQMLHAHVVTPGTYDGGVAGRMDRVIRKPHIRDLHHVTHEVFLGEMERVLGRERTAEIIKQRNERLLDERYPGRKERQHRRASRQRIDRMQQAHDALAIMRRERERKQRKQKDRRRRRRERQEDLRIYLHYANRRRQREREQSYAALREQWEERRRQWEAAHRSELEQLRQEEREMQKQRAREKCLAARKARMRRKWGWQQAQFAIYLSDGDLGFEDGESPDWGIER